MLTGWQQVGGTWYYLKNSGAMATGWQQVGSSWYWLGSNGAMRTGWYTVDGEWNWSDANGVWHANGWQGSPRGWWYAWGDGTYPTSSWQLIGGKWYHFDASGYMQTGWLNSGGNWYYLANSGAMATGWASVSGSWYYFNGSGVMQANRWVGSYWVTGSGAMATNAWIDGGNYYVGSDGVYLANQWVGDYYVGSDGKWIPGYGNTPNQQEPAQEDNSIVGNWVIRAIRASTSGGLVPANDQSIIFVSLENGNAGLRFIREDHNYYGTWSFRDYTDDGEPMFLVEFENGSKWVGEVYEENGVDQLILMSMNDSDYVLLFSLYSRE